MMTCREVSTLVSSGQLAGAPPLRRLAVRMHLAMCRHCRAFVRQLEWLARAGRTSALGFDREPSADFESRLVKELGAAPD